MAAANQGLACAWVGASALSEAGAAGETDATGGAGVPGLAKGGLEPRRSSKPLLALPLLLIDNYDSFTFNLFQQIARVSGVAPIVVPNDRVCLEEIKAMEPGGIVISPGPGRPEVAADFGVCGQVLTGLELPLLGVCLGHQGLGHFFGGKVVHAPRPMHGRLSQVWHGGSGIFRGIPQGFSVVRYHSLAVEAELPGCLERTAWTEDGVIMGLRHRSLPFWGIQFHPESICTTFGDQLIENFVRFAREWQVQVRKGSGRVSKRGASARLRPKGKPRRPSPAAPAVGACELQVRHRCLPFWVDPEAVFLGCFKEKEEAFWLDGNKAEEGLARFSFMGSADGPRGYSLRYDLRERLVRVKRGAGESCVPGGIFEFLKRELAACRVTTPRLPFDFNCGFAGYFGYELKAECGSTAVHDASLPDAAFLFADRILAFDHREREVHLLALTGGELADSGAAWFEEMRQVLETLGPPPPVHFGGEALLGSLRLARGRETYLSDIRACQREIRNGETYEVCLTNQIHTGPVQRPLDLYRILRRVNPAPYAAYLRFGQTAVLSSSPERFLQVGSDRTVTSKPIKGTRPRHADPALDRAERDSLAANEKDRAENLMIVDLVRNDLGRVCEVGSVCVPKLMDVESYATVHQLVTTVQGRLREDADAVDCIRAAFPGGSMTGAPKIRTMEIIDRLEREARGVYSGAIGCLGLNGSADLNIVIRTFVCTPTETTFGTGGAIVDLSDPEDEFQETLLKARALVQAAAQLERGAFDPSDLAIQGAFEGPEGGRRGAGGPAACLSGEASGRASGGSVGSELRLFRGEIDLLDRIIVRALGRRFGVCRRVAGFKSRARMPMMQPERIQAIKRRCALWGERYGVRPEFLHDLYDLIIGEACRMEDEMMSALSKVTPGGGGPHGVQVAEVAQLGGASKARQP